MSRDELPSPKIDRVMDANLNRLREGIRVVEDVVRYIYEDGALAKRLKELRHATKHLAQDRMLPQRNSLDDVLRTSTKEESSRDTLRGILVANFKRAQESARVLEELCKLDSSGYNEHFKSIRYSLYALEKEVLLNPKITSSAHSEQKGARAEDAMV